MGQYRPRILYIGMVCTEAYVAAIGEPAFVGASAGKMSAVVSALRSAGRRAVLVSLPFVGSGPVWQPGRICKGDGHPACFLPVCRGAKLRKALGIFTLAWFSLRAIRTGDTVLFYNHAIEYALAVLLLRARGIVVFQDIEDLPSDADTGLRGFLSRCGYQLMSRMTSPRKVTVSNQIGRSLGARDFIAIPGIAAESPADRNHEKWEDLAAGAPLQVHFGGTLMASTGLDLLCDALAQLDVNSARLDRDIVFIVTGTGELEQIETFAKSLASDRLRLKIFRAIDRQSYFDVFDRCHASLSLRIPDASISRTTFPSKVIEITSRGLALVSTQVSDVVEIFSEDEAWLLQRSEPHELAGILLAMAASPEEVHRRAMAGQRLALERFSSLAVGRALRRFLEEGQSLS